MGAGSMKSAAAQQAHADARDRNKKEEAARVAKAVARRQKARWAALDAQLKNKR